jgi:hypothetical protein
MAFLFCHIACIPECDMYHLEWTFLICCTFTEYQMFFSARQKNKMKVKPYSKIGPYIYSRQHVTKLSTLQDNKWQFPVWHQKIYSFVATGPTWYTHKKWTICHSVSGTQKMSIKSDGIHRCFPNILLTIY